MAENKDGGVRRYLHGLHACHSDYVKGTAYLCPKTQRRVRRGKRWQAKAKKIPYKTLTARARGWLDSGNILTERK